MSEPDAFDLTRQANAEINLLEKKHDEFIEALKKANPRITDEKINELLNSPPLLIDAVIDSSKKGIISDNHGLMSTHEQRTQALLDLNKNNKINKDTVHAINNTANPAAVKDGILHPHKNEPSSIFTKPPAQKTDAVAFLMHEYVKNGGGWLATKKIFGDKPTFETAIARMQERMQKDKGLGGASRSTLKELGYMDYKPPLPAAEKKSSAEAAPTAPKLK